MVFGFQNSILGGSPEGFVFCGKHFQEMLCQTLSRSYLGSEFAQEASLGAIRR